MDSAYGGQNTVAQLPANCDLTNRIFHFESSSSPCIVWLKFQDLDFSAGAPIRRLDLIHTTQRIGDCSTSLERAEPFIVPPPDLN